MKEAIYDAMKGKDEAKATAANPLVQDGKKLVPSVTRVFSSGRDLYVYLQAYEPAATTPRPLIAFVSFYQGQKKIYETQLTAITPATLTHLGTVPINFTIGLQSLPPGQYDCQVTILDPATTKATFWRSQIAVVP